MHQNPPTSPNNLAERSQQFVLPLQNTSQIPLQHPLPDINVQTGVGQREVSYADDDDTISEYSSHGMQHDFFDTELGEVLDELDKQVLKKSIPYYAEILEFQD